MHHVTSVHDPASSRKGLAGTWIHAMTGSHPKVPPGFHPLAADWHDIVKREQALGIPHGMPVLASGAYVDDRLNAYFLQAFPRDRMSTANTYAVELRTWLTFLDRRDVQWDSASRSDVRSYQLWRVYDERNVARVTPATWNKGWAALRHFYDWARRENWIEVSPVGDQERLRSSGLVGGHREKNARTSRDRWLTPMEFAMWRDVGLRGYQASITDQARMIAGLPKATFRGRNTARNAAFVDYVISSGLRKAEAGLLLEMEIPSTVGEQTPIVGKGGMFRHYLVLERRGLDSVRSYVIGERRDVVRKAQRLGRYEKAKDRLVIAEALPDGRRGQRIRLAGGRTVDVPRLSYEERMRLFSEGPDGLEPASLWLTETGDPLPHSTWNSVFNAANGRVTTARRKFGVNSPWVRVTPHSLRFTFALMALVAGVRATDKQLGLEAADPFFIGNYSHMFDWVSDLLGHASVATTRKIYLEPVKSLRRASILRGESVSEVWAAIAEENPLVGFGKIN